MSDLPPKARLPSLNQLAARINPTPAPTTSLSAPRPRLAASVLRTGSAVSLVPSTADSLAVNAPTSPANTNTNTNTSSSTTASPSPTPQHPHSSTTPVPEGGQALTSERLEELNQENAAAAAAVGDEDDGAPAPLPMPMQASNSKFVKGYKNVPSLDAITARMVRTRQLSIDGTAKPPEPDLVEDPKAPGVHLKPTEHPLQFPWTIFHDTKAKFPFTPVPAAQGEPPLSAAPIPESTVEYEAGLTVIGEFSTIESFWRHFNWLKPPSALEKNSNYHLFKSGIKPMWEDEANANGGKWVLTMKNNPQLLDRCWYNLALALIGEELEDGDEICGVVVSLRIKVDRIQLWTRNKDDVEKVNAIGKKMVKLLEVSEADGIGLEFQYNSDDRPPPNKFLSIQSLPTTSYRSSFQGLPNTPANAAAGGAFGSFGVGIGNASWKAGVKR